MAADLLIRNGYVLQDAASGKIRERGYVAVSGGVITEIGSVDSMPPELQESTKVIDAEGCLIMPGIVNAHTHLAGNIFRGVIEEEIAGLHTIAFPVEQHFESDDIYWLVLLGLIEVVKAGCTTVNDIYYFADRLAEACQQVGVRAVLAEKIFDADFIEIRHERYVRLPEQRREKLQRGVDLVERWHGANGGLITTRLGPHAPDTCSEEMLREVLAEADRLGVGIHIHTAQNPREMELIREEHGCSAIEYLHQLGYLRPDMIGVHGRFNTMSDNELMAAGGAKLAYCPTVYPRRGAVPPLWDFLTAGVEVGFGTDWIIMDPWDGLRHAMYWYRAATGDWNDMQARQALSLHTAGGANILGLDVGVLDIGKAADIILLDVRQPHFTPFYGNLAGLLYHASRHDVRTTIVNGNVIMDDGRVLGVDEDAVVAEVQRRVPRFREWLATVDR